MANPVFADGVNLDTLASWIGVGSNRWSVPGVKGENVLVPARHGSLWVADKTFEEGSFSLEIIVQGSRENGFVPLDQLAQARENLDRLLRIFGKRKRLIHFRHQLDNGNEIECYAECIGSFDVNRDSSLLPFSRFTAEFRIPSAFWQDFDLRFYTSPGGLVDSQNLPMQPFEGGTAPMDDGVYLVHGPVDNPELKVIETGAYVRLHNFTLRANQTWRIDASTWSSTVGTKGSVTFSNRGSSVVSRTVHGGSASFLDLPPLIPGQVALEVGGLNTGPTTQIEARGRRKHLIG